MSELKRRTAFVVVAIPVSGTLIWYGGFPFALMLSALCGLLAWEFYRLAAVGGVQAFDRAGIALAALLPVIVHTNYIGWTNIPVVAGAMVILVIFTSALWLRVGKRPLTAVAVTIFGILYTGGLFSYGHALRYHRFVIDRGGGTALLFFGLVITWATEMGGYGFGRKWGKTKLMPSVSPGKTILGAVSGLILAVLVTGLYTAFVLKPVAHLSMGRVGIAVVGITVSFAAQVGDLCESLLKREAGVKDSSAMIPGHGGALDRFDAILFVIPVTYVLVGEFLRPVA